MTFVTEVRRIDAESLREWPALERLHRTLRTELGADYVLEMRRILAGRGELVALHDGAPVGLALYRWVRTSRCGQALLQYLEDTARAGGARGVELESGLEREETHRFYERRGNERFAVSYRRLVGR